MPHVPSPDWLSWGFWAQNSAAFRNFLITIAALVGIPFVVWREWLHHRQTTPALQQAGIARQQAATAQLCYEAQVEADRERRITNNFTRAVELLGSDKLETGWERSTPLGASPGLVLSRSGFFPEEERLLPHPKRSLVGER